MGILADFREVIKELKHKKRGEATINRCPKCGNPNIMISSGFGTYPRMYGITPRKICLRRMWLQWTYSDGADKRRKRLIRQFYA